MALDKTLLRNDIELKMTAILTAKGIATNFYIGNGHEVLLALAEAIVEHIVTRLEVHGVATNLNPGISTIESYTTGIGSHGGSLVSTTGGPVSGTVVNGNVTTAIQTNNGPGLVS